jgi:N6-L-threonylcarbamoyladenine synthase
MDDPLRMRLVGRTIDDAIGEAFDKAATLLDLGYPGGPALDRRSDAGDPGAVRFPVPRLTARSVRGAGAAATDPDARTLDFSFSGMKTALLYSVRGVPPVPGRPAPPAPVPLTPQRVADLCASFQHAAVAQVIDVLTRALEPGPDAPGAPSPRTLLVGGGVSANRHLRAELARFGERHGIAVRLPGLEYCLDNAAMIAALAHWRLAAGECDDLTLAPQAQSALGRG